MTNPAIYSEIDAILQEAKAKGKKTVAFFSSTTAMTIWSWAIPVIPTLQADGFFVVALATYDFPEAARAGLPFYQVDKEELDKIENLDGMVMSDFDHGNFPPRARILAVEHAYSYARCWNHLPCIRTQLWYDGYLTNVPLAPEIICDLWHNIPLPQKGTRASSRFDVISCGNLNAAALQKRLAQEQRIPDAICYAPAGAGMRMDEGGDRIKIYGRKIIRALLSCFPEYKTIFRVAPYQEADDESLKIAAEFASNPNFILDTSKDKFETFARSAAIVTDISHIMNSFSFATMRPTVAFRPWLKGKGLLIAPFGAVASSYSHLTMALKKLLGAQSGTEEMIRKGRDYASMPVETAFEDFSRLLRRFIDDEPLANCQNWANIKRDIHTDEYDELDALFRLFSLVKFNGEIVNWLLKDYAVHSKGDFSLAASAYIIMKSKFTPEMQVEAFIIEKLGADNKFGDNLLYKDLAKFAYSRFKEELLRQIKNKDVDKIYQVERLLEIMQ